MASVIDDVVMDPIENALDAVGLMQGPLAPAKRTVVGAALGAAVTFAWKPEIAFNQDGTLRPWSAMSEEPNATPMPWWMFVAFPALVLGVLI